MVKAFVFDLDGTIIDTEKVIFKAYKEALSLYDYELTLDVWAQFVGGVGTPAFICEHVEKVTGKTINVEKTVAYGEEVLRTYLRKEGPIPGAIELLESAIQAGLQIALATNADQKWAMGHLQNLQIHDYFDAILTVEHVHNPKPDPEIYMKAVETLGVAPIEAVAFEDSIIGSQAAVTAGLHTVAIPSSLMKHENFDHVHLKLDSLEFLEATFFTTIFQRAKDTRKIG